MKKIFTLFLILLLCFSLVCCKAKFQKFTDYSFDTFDTVTTIIGFETKKEEFDKNCNKIKEWLLEYHKLYDIYKSYNGINNLYTLNHSQGETVKVDSKIIDLLVYSKELYSKTNGKLNVAMGSVLSIWHNCRDNGIKNPTTATLPNKTDLENAAKHIDFNKVVIDTKAQTVLIKDKELTLDVGAIAKGYAAQEVTNKMNAAGMTGYLLNIGGNVKIIANRNDNQKWTVGIENPVKDNEQAYIEKLNLGDNLSLVTSGSYQRFYTVNGKNFHHIIDSSTLYPAEFFTSVSVLCKDSALADGLSTTLFCLNYEEGKELLKNFKDVHVMWVTQNGKKYYSENFKDYIIKQ